MRAEILFLTVFLFLLNCDNNNPSSSPSIVNTETWHLLDADDTENKADMSLNSLSDNTISVTGKWVYIFWEDSITCTFLSGSAMIKNDTSVTINVNGTACYPPDSTGYMESSPFNLVMNGTFTKGSSKGTWKISFTKEIWKDWGMDGTFTGALKQGQGITK